MPALRSRSLAGPQHVEAINRDGLFIEGANFQEPIAVAASTEVAAAAAAEIVLFCVKTLDTETAARALAPHLAPGALVLSCQNGVDNCERIRAATGIEAIADRRLCRGRDERPRPGEAFRTQ